MSCSLRVLVACEFSQTVMREFLALGHDSWSCDLQDSVGPFPSRHIKGDVLSVLSDGWDLIVAHPPCTFLSHAGEGHFNLLSDSGFDRWRERLSAARFFLQLYNSPCQHVAVENPVGFMNLPSVFRKPDQILQPFHFGDNVCKRTCLWLRGLPPLQATSYVRPARVFSFRRNRYVNSWEIETVRLSAADRKNKRSVFFPGVASAMASQWSDYLLHVKFGLPRRFPGIQSEFDFS